METQPACSVAAESAPKAPGWENEKGPVGRLGDEDSGRGPLESAMTTKYPGTPAVIHGNGAVAEVMSQVCGGVIGYPITPST